MTAVMVVRIDNLTLDLKGDFVLKLYDRHYTNDIRDEEHIHELTTNVDMEFRKFMLTDGGEELVRQQAECALFQFGDEKEAKVASTGNDEDGSIDEEQTILPDDSPDNDDNLEQTDEAYSEDDFWQPPQLEAWIYANCDKMYRNEAKAYHLVQDRQEIDIPRLIVCIDIPSAHCSKLVNPDLRSEFEDISGLLLQYVPGFPLSDLYNHPRFRSVPREQWQRIIDEAVTIFNTMGKRGICNRDADVRNTVVHFDPIAQRYTTKLIDFGHCIFKKDGIREWEWRREQSFFDEEGKIGMDMQLFFEENEK